MAFSRAILWVSSSQTGWRVFPKNRSSPILWLLSLLFTGSEKLRCFSEDPWSISFFLTLFELPPSLCTILQFTKQFRITNESRHPPLTCTIDAQGRSKLTSGESILKWSIRSFLTHLTNACIDHFGRRIYCVRFVISCMSRAWRHLDLTHVPLVT